MRLMQRNLSPVWYCLYKGKEVLYDDDGNETSEYRIIYEKPVKFMCSVSPATGSTQANMFGNLDSYDKVLITDDMRCPIDENTVLFVDKRPGYNESFDYTVKRVARSLNCISIAISKVKVT